MIALPSVQSLFLEMTFGEQKLSSGTGFVCESKRGPVLITNWHNLAGRDPETKQPLSKHGGIPDTLRIVHKKADSLGWVTKTEPLLDAGNPRWIEHPHLADRADIVALPLSDLSGVQLYPHDPNGGPRLAVGPADPVSVVGFPFGLSGGGSLALWATGFVASEPDVDFQSLPVFLVDCRARPGQSGSAVIAHTNGGVVRFEGGQVGAVDGAMTRFLGIYSGRINAQSDLGRVWKATAVAELVASI